MPAFIGDLSSPFAVLGAPKSFSLDEKALETRYYELSKRLHPDRFAAGGAAAKMKSHELSAALNKAYVALKQPESRLETLLRSAGALKDGERATSGQAQIPAELAEEYFEIQEAVMEDELKARELIMRFGATLDGKRQALTQEMFELASKTDWNDPSATAAKSAIDRIVELRRQRSYVKSMLDNLARLGSNPGAIHV